VKTPTAFDIETTGLSPYHGARIFTYCHGTIDTGIKVVRGDETRGELIRFFLNTRTAKIAHNAKFELSFLVAESIPMPEETEWHDTMIMSQMLRNDAMSHALDKLADLYCDDEATKKYWRDIDNRVDQQATARGDGPGSKRFDRVDPALLHDYQINDGDRTLLLFHLFEDELRAKPRMWADYENEIKLVRVTQRMEQRGIKLHRANAERLIKWMQDEVDKVRERTFELLGEYVNLNSPDQIARILFKILNLPILQFTASGKPQTDKDVLLMLR
jgi:DNA polymerase-1